MHRSLYSAEFNSFVTNMTSFLFNASNVSDSFKQVAQKLAHFKVTVPTANKNVTSKLVVDLTTALDGVNYKYNCLAEKMKDMNCDNKN